MILARVRANSTMLNWLYRRCHDERLDGLPLRERSLRMGVGRPIFRSWKEFEALSLVGILIVRFSLLNKPPARSVCSFCQTPSHHSFQALDCFHEAVTTFVSSTLHSII